VIINIFTARIDVGKKGIDPASDIGQAQVEDAEVVLPPSSRTQSAENVQSKNKGSSDELLRTESITQSE